MTQLQKGDYVKAKENSAYNQFIGEILQITSINSTEPYPITVQPISVDTSLREPGLPYNKEELEKISKEKAAPYII